MFAEGDVGGLSEARSELAVRTLELIKVMVYGGAPYPGILEGLATADLSDLTLPQLSALLLLIREPVSMGALAEHLRVSISSASSIAKRLESRGLIRRSRGSHDHRVILCFLTDEGERRVDRLYEHQRSEIEGRLADLSLGELGTIAHALELLIGIVPAA